MEPLNCIADVKGGKCEIWGPIQAPDWVRTDLARLMELKFEDVTVNMTFSVEGLEEKLSSIIHTRPLLSQRLSIHRFRLCGRGKTI
jgi:isoquinoline 1-oxidoreductase beta subunit